MTGMLTAPALDWVGAFINELRADSDVASLVGRRVRGFEPGPGDAKGVGEYQAFIVVSDLSSPPHPRVPITFAEANVRCYGTTAENAKAVWNAVVKAMHQVGPRTKSNGLVIYQSLALTGNGQDRDPDTKQPLYSGTVRFTASLISATA